MALGIYEEEDIRAIAEEIRFCKGGCGHMTVKEMREEIPNVKEFGFSEGWSDGYNSGLTKGNEQGLEEGKAIGYAEGKTDGIAEGKKSQYDEFWDSIQNYGNRRDYSYCFGYTWGGGIFNPKYDIICGNASSIHALLYYSKVSDTKVTIYAVGANNSTSIFANAKELHTIRKIVVSEMNKFTSWFDYCYALENLAIEGTIGQKGFNVQWSTKLSHDSLMSIINALKDNSGSDTWNTITLGPDNIAKLTQEERDIMEQKHWEYT